MNVMRRDSRLKKNLESKARRVAKRAGLDARKSRRRKESIDNLGGFMLVDPQTNSVVNGNRFDLTAGDVIEQCKDV
jgi:hypothetical protein